MVLWPCTFCRDPSRAINGVLTPILSLQLSRSDITNAEDGVLSRRLLSTYPVSAVILKNTDNADTDSYCCDAVSMLSAFLGQLFQWTPLSTAPGSATGTGMLSAMGEVHHMNMWQEHSYYRLLLSCARNMSRASVITVTLKSRLRHLRSLETEPLDRSYTTHH